MSVDYARPGTILINRLQAFPFERLNKNDSALLILDLQTGLYGLARDFDATLYHNAMVAHAALGKIFDIPVVMTTSAQSGPNGPLPKEILDMYVKGVMSPSTYQRQLLT